MYLDQLGNVRPCCQNSAGLLGNVREQSLHDIWRSASADALRRSLSAGDFSMGCGFCGWQTEELGYSPFARGFDGDLVTDLSPPWPHQMEFSLTNSCNLQCVMCNGEWSSSIRAHREHRPPLPVVYGPAFFGELEDFLPHLRRAKFLGGEPFLGSEPLKVMDMLVSIGSDAAVSITTNGTQLTPRVERICSHLDASIVVSIDGATKATYESIRVGADFDVVLDNITRFADLTGDPGTKLSFAHCLMTSNWHEFADLLLLAESIGVAHVGINTVVFPRSQSLYQLSRPELDQVIHAMTAREAEVGAGLDRFREVWDEQLEGLRRRSDALLRGDPPAVDPWIQLLQEDSPVISGMWDWGEREPMKVTCANDWPVVDGLEITRPIIAVDRTFAELVGIPESEICGRPMSFVLDALRVPFGDHYSVQLVADGSDSGVLVRFATNDGDISLRVIFVDRGDEIDVLLAQRST
jgi:MoaA/NifB/PqqE/SkfB family radical SAM enzyme